MITELEICRKRLGMNQRQLAQKIGYHQSMISKYERGFTRRVSERFKNQISKSLGVSKELIFQDK